jgi:hypothetical protein
MSKKHDKIIDLLYRSFDTPLTRRERKELDLALEKSEQLQQEKREIETQREAIRQSGQDYSFKPSFADSVINHITGKNRKLPKGDLFMESLLTFFKRLSIAAAAACILLIAYNLSKGESFQPEEAFFISQDAYEEIMELSLF